VSQQGSQKTKDMVTAFSFVELDNAGKPIEKEEYAEYLRSVLPKTYMGSRHWEFVKRDFLFNPAWGDPVRASGSW